MREDVIKYLKMTDYYVSGADLSRQLGVSRSAVWKCIEDLRADGYQIEAVPHYGYRLAAVPDKLVATEVQNGLGTRKFGCDVRYFDEMPSTMDEAFALGMSGAPEGTVVIAEAQTKGRGRMGRVWSSPKAKGLYFSILLRPQLSPSEAAKLTLITAVALSEAVESFANVAPSIKWPNDLLLSGRKMGGILTELRAEVDRVDFAVIGIGLNVNSTHKELPPVATSLKAEQGSTFDRVKLMQEVLRALERRYTGLKKNGFRPALEEWCRRSATIGRRVSFDDRGGKREGTALGLADDGGLLVRLDSGETVKRIAGDVVLEKK